MTSPPAQYELERRNVGLLLVLLSYCCYCQSVKLDVVMHSCMIPKHVNNNRQSYSTRTPSKTAEKLEIAGHLSLSLSALTLRAVSPPCQNCLFGMMCFSVRDVCASPRSYNVPVHTAVQSRLPAAAGIELNEVYLKIKRLSRPEESCHLAASPASVMTKTTLVRQHWVV